MIAKFTATKGCKKARTRVYSVDRQAKRLARRHERRINRTLLHVQWEEYEFKPHRHTERDIS